MLGNGDIWEAADALRMVRETGAAGVVVGRGCLGRPWLFRDLATAFAGETRSPTLPALGEVAAMMRRHAELLCQHMGEERGCKELRKHVAWYLKGFAAGGELRNSLALVSSLAALDELLSRLDPDRAVPGSGAGHASRPTGQPSTRRAPARVARRHRRHGLRSRGGPALRRLRCIECPAGSGRVATCAPP